jgi:anhydro-N-acetylmuramic acid kinase
MSKSFCSLGLMSGTSMDGVDASIIQSDGESEYRDILDKYYEYPKNIYNNLTKIRDKIKKKEDLKKFLKEISILEKDITLFHAEIVNELAKDKKTNIDLVGFHGQTIFHNASEKISKQLGDGKLLSKITKKTVIYDFRQNDLKHGGTGAPLTPIFHLLLSKKKFKQNKLPILILNIGGIANATYIKHYDKNKNFLTALDIGPGNCLIDKWIRKKSKKNYDANGLVAKSGTINKVILDKAISSWITRLNKNISHPASHDISDYDYSFANELSLEDGAATITEYSSEICSRYINKIMIEVTYPKAIIICGGGRKNKFLMESFKKKIYCPLTKIDDFNINGDFVESKAFAYLAIRSYLKLPISFPSTTGVKLPCTGGEIIKI